jgi:hypothetical protein
VKSTIIGPYKMELESKRMVPEYDITIKIRQPLVEKEFKVVSKPALKITKLFPPFEEDGKEPDSQSMNDLVNNKSTSTKKSAQVDKKEEVLLIKQEQAKTKPIDPKPEQPKSNVVVDKSQFSELELKDPDNIDMLNTLQVLEFKIAKVDKEIAQVEGRIPSNLRQKKLYLSCKRNKLKQAIEGGEIELKDYLKIARNQFEKDLKLAKYFEQINDNSKKQLVMERVQVLKKEIQEGETYLKK